MAVERLLLENGDFLLLETGDKLLLESSTGGGGTEYIISPTGGVVFSGTSTYIQSKFIIPEGGILLSGTGLDLRTKVVFIAGGVTFGGTGDMTSNTIVVTGTVGERTKVGVGT